ncbi:hypothetical protein GCM10027184_61300 [Saccharothrix stipae]
MGGRRSWLRSVPGSVRADPLPGEASSLFGVYLPSSPMRRTIGRVEELALSADDTRALLIGML